MEKRMKNNKNQQGWYVHDSKIFKLVKDLDVRGKCAYGAIGADVTHMTQNGANRKTIRSSEVTAAKVGTSARIVERVRTIMDRGNDELWSLLDSGKITINAAYRQVTEYVLPKKQLSVAELFMKILDITVPEKRCVRFLEVKELNLVNQMAKIFLDEGYLSITEYSRLQSQISDRLK